MYLRNGTARKLRRTTTHVGIAHQLTFSCYHRLRLLSRDRTRLWLVEALEAARKKHHFEVWAYVIMPEHVHILLYPTEPDYSMAVIRQAIKQPVARQAVAFLKEHNPGLLSKLRISRKNKPDAYRFWQPGGGYDRDITIGRTAWAAVEYIHRNPVRRELAAHETDWPWSSARWYAGEDDVPLMMDATPPVT